MGGALLRASYSPNIKIRRVFSCALFGAHGRLLAPAAHIPVHMGVRSGMARLSAVHDHMSNTLNTPIESSKMTYAMRIREYSIRHGTGGDGLRRDIEFLAPARVTRITERRRIAPYGLHGGAPGARGVNVLIKPDGTETELPGKVSISVATGDIISIRTPGGGGWGKMSGRAWQSCSLLNDTLTRLRLCRRDYSTSVLLSRRSERIEPRAWVPRPLSSYFQRQRVEPAQHKRAGGGAIPRPGEDIERTRIRGRPERP